MLLLIDGCGSGKKPRFTEEELANIPFPQRDGLPECSGGFVLAVGSETITADEMVLSLAPDFKQVAQSSTFEQFKEHARAQIEQIITVRVLNILLYSKPVRVLAKLWKSWRRRKWRGFLPASVVMTPKPTRHLKKKE